MTSRIVIALLLVIIAFLVGVVWYQARPADSTAPVPVEQWSATTSVPKTETSTPKVSEPLSSRVVVTTPASGAPVPHEFTLAGRAPGPWYFEASFPIIVTDESGAKIATAHAQAQGEWMTEQDVPFTAHVDVGEYRGPATLNLLKDNPSGLPEHDDSVAFPVVVQ